MTRTAPMFHALATIALLAVVGCGPDLPTVDAAPTPAEPAAPPPPGQTGTLYLAHARFENVVDPDSGKSKPVPAPARLTLVRGTGAAWETEQLDDADSNVFHKALEIEAADGTPRLLTIGANQARLKTWTRGDDGWTATTHWAPTFGGQQERLRDVEVGDVTGDGRDDLVIATHDMGVVAVVEIPADGADWTVHEVARTAERTFVHEVEIGDVDGDGTAEFFVTPSAPNVLDGTPQPGRIVGYRFADGAATSFDVDSFLGAHVKEILVADLEGRGRADLYASIEPERTRVGTSVQTTDPLIVRRYRWEDGTVESTDIATFNDEQCRFLVHGDLTGDGRTELIASTMTAGIWMLRQGQDGWTSERIAKDSTSAEFEHAAAVLDLDGDGKPELYVVSDGLPNQATTLRRWVYDGAGFRQEDVVTIGTDHMTFNVTAGTL